MSISLTISVGYQRRRAGTTDQLEQRMDALGLFLLGGAVVLLLLWFIVPRFLDWVTHLAGG